MKQEYFLAAFLSAVFLIVGLFTLSDYGINWDSPLHMLRGQAYAHLFLTGKDAYGLPESVSPNLVSPPGYKVSRYYFASSELWENGPRGIVELPERAIPQLTDRKIFYQSEAWNGRYFMENDWEGHLALPAILGAITNQTLWGGWGLIGDLQSYQLVYLLLSSLGIFIVTVFAAEVSGSLFAGFVAGVSLALFPIFFAESHFNLKDPPQAVFFAGAVWTFWKWVRSGDSGRSGRWFGGFGIFVALALGVKWNIVFLPFIILPWLFLIRKTEEFKRWFNLKRLSSLGLIFLLFTFSFLILIWPYSWGRPKSLLNIAGYYLQTGTGSSLIQPGGHIFFGFNLYPLKLLFFQTPEVVLFLLGIGVIWAIKKGGGGIKTGYLLLFWFLIPAVRIILPGARTYGGLRQIMEIFPALAVLAGVGGSYLLNRFMIYDLGFKNIHKLSLRDKSLKSLIFNLKSIFLLLVTGYLLLLPIWKLHPNQNVYFNAIAGGVKGAVDKNLVDWTLTYGNIYKQGVDWLNLHAEKDANLAHLAGSDFAISPLWLRDDISTSPDHFSGFRQSGEYILALYNPLDPPVFAKRYPEKFLLSVHTIDVDGVPMFFIYKNEPKFLKLNFTKEQNMRVKMVPISSKEVDFWKIDLKKDLKVTKVILDGAEMNCIDNQNEAIAFIPEDKIKVPVDLTQAYVLNEKKNLGEDRVEYSFAAEKARFIYIYPQNEFSCFAKESIMQISYLDD